MQAGKLGADMFRQQLPGRERETTDNRQMTDRLWTDNRQMTNG